MRNYLEVETVKPFAVNTFAKRLGFKHGNAYGFKGLLHQLERKGLIEIQQGGFNADSMHHNKLVIVKDLDYIHKFINPHFSPERKPLKWHRRRKCHHKDFRIVTVLSDIQVLDKRIRKVILKCGLCNFYLLGFELDGKMAQVKVFSELTNLSPGY